MRARPYYSDRHDAGRQLAEQLDHYKDLPHVLVLALPRGGVAVGYEVAQALHAPLDVFVVRKLGLPGHEEYAMGAIASGGIRVMNPLPGITVPPEALAAVLAKEQTELIRREQLYRAQRPPIHIAGRTVILVDDGLATGATMRAAAVAVRQQHPSRLVVAVPVGARDSCQSLSDVADEIVCPAMPEPFHALSLWYDFMPQSSDDEVRTLLQKAWREHLSKTQPAATPAARSARH
ncbi:MAG: phosphoribosyltransferase [Polaromonas sp.]|nr:phosphoribosyltransferase [Polaromonas sp.]